jgi:hypothetical protein
MRATLNAIVLSIVSGAACAQPANEAVKGLESCFQAARIADSICSATNDPVQGLDCFKNARAAQVECLQHVVSRRSTKSAAPEIPTGTLSSATPHGTDRPEMPRAVSPGIPTTGIISPKSPAGSVSVEMPSAVSPDKTPVTVPPDMPTRTVDSPANSPDTNWVVSETSSPIDYSPQITAAIRSTSGEKDAPNTLTIRCRQLRTELLLRTEGTWRISRTSEIKVDYQINEQSFVSLQWAASADGKAATYKDDAVGFLRSLPEGARLKINVFDGSGPGHDATFQLTGLDVIRKKIAVACKWVPAADKMSSEKR